MWSDPVFIDNLVIPIAGMVTGIILGLPIVRAAIRHFERRSGVGSGDSERLEIGVHDMRERLAALEERVELRMTEVEERIEFTERILTRHGDRPAQPGSG
jgi:hypothetical protein